MKIHILGYSNDGPSWGVPLSVTEHHILFFVTRGIALYHFDDSTVRVNQGEGMFIRQNIARWAEPAGKEPISMYYIHFREVADADLHAFDGERYRLLQPLNFDYLKQRFSMLVECWIGRMPSYDLISRGMAMELLGVVQMDLIGSAHSPARRNLASRVQQYIVQHYKKPIRMEEIAAEVERSPAYVSTVFKEVTGRTPVEYMHQVRITAARELLLTSNKTIGEISELLGYCDPTYFTTIYKKFVGHPPSKMVKERR